MFKSDTSITELQYTTKGLCPINKSNRRKGTRRPAEATLRRLKKQRQAQQNDCRPILWMCYSSLVAWTFLLGTMFIF